LSESGVAGTVNLRVKNFKIPLAEVENFLFLYEASAISGRSTSNERQQASGTGKNRDGA